MPRLLGEESHCRALSGHMKIATIFPRLSKIIETRRVVKMLQRHVVLSGARSRSRLLGTVVGLR